MPIDTAKLATLVASRLCHDLVSPVGAISNGLELIALAGTPGPEEMELIEQSCTSATARLNFFRVAFGNASTEQDVGYREAAKLLANYSAGSRLVMEWTLTTDAPRTEVQLAFLAALCCESALPMGGKVKVGLDGETWHISGTGQRVAPEEHLWSALSTASYDDDLAPARVQFALLAMLAPRRGRKLISHAGEAGASLEIV
ncbi:histidine phosphotransferase [Salipiger pallidus]|uniref:Histidine phosphotransferase n=1 Tax=Salipiger pallidus TaxID=1775170 RepID=A0A8J3EFF6_9RHOB|nr:histidine phosphotransferase family protein [Salipiger pallidus]GGG59476.1 histidine phosphotransferase [Salipiger pallidus]